MTSRDPERLNSWSQCT